MKLQNLNSVPLSQRCTHNDTNGRQCRSLASAAHPGLCPHHLAVEKQKEGANVYAPLIRNSQGLQTAQGINYSLSNLYELLAKNRISSRRASVLAYISSLLLRTLPQIDADNAAGIKFPPKNLTVTNSVPGPGPDSDSNPHPDSTNVWDPANPEPDPEKKPS